MLRDWSKNVTEKKVCSHTYCATACSHQGILLAVAKHFSDCLQCLGTGKRIKKHNRINIALSERLLNRDPLILTDCIGIGLARNQTPLYDQTPPCSQSAISRVVALDSVLLPRLL